MSDKQSLVEIVKSKIGDALFVIASNREPYMHVRDGENIKCIRPASGMATALDSVMRACGGVWVAHGSGNADKAVVDKKNGLLVPEGEGRYRLRRVWMSRREEEGYYDIVSNEMFWPLCHTVYVRPVFDEHAWRFYRKINERFAKAVLSEIGGRRAFVWFQDFHLSLAARFLKEKRGDIVTAHFWHIPWPQNETFRACPWKNEILKGLLSNDLLGFHTRYHCNNFLETVDRNIEAKTDRAEYSVSYRGSKTHVIPFPISVDYGRIGPLSDKSVKAGGVDLLKTRYGLHDKLVILGVERVDYTKGIPEKLKALDWFLRKNPEYLEKIVYLQIGAPSRMRLDEYRRVNEDIEELVEEINWRHGTDKWSPVVYINKHHDFDEILSFYRLADYCIVSSLHDGMNLVAKEYLSSKTDEDGMLILSRFAGAAEELGDALLVNPYDTRRFYNLLKKAVKMKPSEKKKRMRKMREIVRENNIYTWAENIISQISRLT
jgi:trehalose-6-phosphate synthase